MSAVAEFQPTALADRNRISRLHGEHAILVAHIKNIHRRAYGEWTDLDAVWSQFTEELEAHLTFEERELFDRFLREHPDKEDYIRALVADHEEIRVAVERLGVDIQLHVVRAEAVDALLSALKQHAALEAELFYPWLEETLS